MKYKCCMFDLDGTIINTIHAITYTTNLVMEKVGLGPLTEDQMKKIVGDGYKTQMKRCLLACGDTKLLHYEEVLPLYRELFAKYSTYQLEAYPGMPELLEKMRAAGMKLVVFTNKPHERAIENVELVYGEDYFDAILGEQDGIPKKPDPAGAKILLDKMQITAEECLYMGDTNTDMQTAKNAGMDAVGAVWGFRGREELEAFSPKYLAETPLEVVKFLGI